MTGSCTDLGRIIAHLRAAVLEIERSIAALERQSAESRLNAELGVHSELGLRKDAARVAAVKKCGKKCA
jgi:hypothetical protein